MNRSFNIGPNEDPSKTFRRKLTKSVPRFLAYCSIMRACHAFPQLRRDRPIVLGLVLPVGGDPAVYEEAAGYAVDGLSIVTYGQRDNSAVLSAVADRKKKPGKEVDLSGSLAAYQRLLVIAETLESMPDGVDIAADGVVEIGPVLPRHVMAAAKLCLNWSITQEQADFIATFPLTVIGSALRRGRPVPAAIEAMKRAMLPKPKDVSGPTLEHLR
jgi:cell division protease FtsH